MLVLGLGLGCLKMVWIPYATLVPIVYLEASVYLQRLLILSNRLWRVPKGNMGVYDPTEIHNRGQLKFHMRDVLINVGFHLVAFFIYLYWYVMSSVPNVKDIA
jgi:hypothetical protein